MNHSTFFTRLLKNFAFAAAGAALSAGIAPLALAANITARLNHSETLLQNGNVLILGGVNEAGTYISAVQIYDMAQSDVVTAITASALAQRSHHTATLLADGRVLVAGGANQPTSLAHFDPANNTLTAFSAALTGGRQYHTATLLRNGTVLIAGGMNSAGVTDAATTGLIISVSGSNATVTTTGDMITPRYGHTATLLRNGHVFVSGGVTKNTDGSFRFVETTEVYNPDLNVWSPGPAMIRHRAFHTATALNDGHVILAGGRDSTNKYDNNESILGTQGYAAEVDNYDPFANIIVPAPPMPVRMASHTATLEGNGAIHLLGGFGNFYDEHIPGPFSVYQSTLVFNSVAGSTNVVTLNNTTSGLSLTMDQTLSKTLVTGTFTEAYVILDTAAIVAPDANISINPTYQTFDVISGYHTISDIAGKNIFAGRLRGEFPVLINDGSATFPAKSCTVMQYPPNTAITLSSDLLPGGQITVYNTTATIYGHLELDNTEYIYSSAPQGRTRIISGYGYVITLTMETPSPQSLQLDFIGEIAATAGEGPASSLPMNVTAPTDISAPYANIPFEVTMPIGTLYNNGESTATAGMYSNFTPTNGTMQVYFAASPISVQGMSYNTLIATMAVKGFIFGETLSYYPSTSSWSLNSRTFGFETPTGKAYVYPMYNHATVLTPAADLSAWGGKDCSRDTRTIPPTSSGFEQWSNCAEADRVAISRNLRIIHNSSGWNSTGLLSQARGQHTASLLPNGKIMVAGGTDGTVTLASAELLDPSTSTWVSAGTMTYSRSNHTATMMPNGNILVAGGYTQGVTTGSISGTDIYFPSENTWVRTTPMNMARQSHSAVMIPRGPYGGQILVIGGYSNDRYLNTMERYDPVSSSWTTLSTTLITKRSLHSTLMLHNGNILICGGVNGTEGTLNSCETVIIGEDGTFTVQAAPALNQKRHSHTATLLRDGRVVITGGNNGAGEIRWQNIIDGGARSAPTSERSTIDANGNVTSWTMGSNNLYADFATGQELIFGRQNHTATLLPNGKVLVLGGVTGLKQAVPYEESYGPDFSSWTHVGSELARGYHTTVLTSSGMAIVIGGYDGTSYVDTVMYRYFMATPDSSDPSTEAAPLISMRQPSKITLDKEIMAKADTITLQSGSTNFMGISEGSGGGTGGQNSYHSHPRIYMYMTDTIGGWMLDVSSLAFSTANLANISDWNLVRSSITFALPSLPYGWYQLRVANNALFSDGIKTLISKPVPGGVANSVDFIGKTTNTITWSWNWTLGEFTDTEGFEVRSATNSVFLATAAYNAADTSATYILGNIGPNTGVTIKVAPFNLTKAGTFLQSATHYTYANPPQDLIITSATFSSVSLEWNANSNSDITKYEISMANDSGFAANISTPVPFATSLTTNTVSITNLAAGTTYYFRVRAVNGSGELTDFNCGGLVPCPSTMTITSPSSVVGVANGTTTIRWSWQNTEAATSYHVYTTTDTTFIAEVGQSTATTPNYTMVNLATNTAYSMQVRALSGSSIFSDFTPSPTVYTLADIPAPYGSAAQTLSAGTGTITAYWLGQTNPSGTIYTANLSTTSAFENILATATVTQTNTSAYLTATFPDLTPCASYYIRVCAENGDAVKTNYVLLSTAPKYTYPTTPGNFVPSDIAASTVRLTWSANGNAAGTHYQLTYSTWPDNPYPNMLISYDDNFSETTYTVTGLWTQTSYYFYLGAKNGSPYPDAKNYSATVSLTPEYIVTSAGPTGTSTGAISGYSGDRVISGILPTGRTVTMTVPDAAFASTSTELSMSENPAINLCPSGMPTPITFRILATPGQQQQVPVTFDFTYGSTELAGVDKTKLVLARYNEITRECMPLQTTIAPSGTRKITATLNVLSSYFQLMTVTTATDLNSVFIYPNPFYPNRGNGFVTFSNLPMVASVRIYTLSGDKVWEGSKNSAGPLVWEGKNSAGNKAASGVYLAVVEGAGQTKVFKVAVER